MVCQVVIEFRSTEGVSEQEILSWMRKVLPDTRAAEGCVSVAVTRDQDDPRNFMFVEQWETRSHYGKYFEWRRQTGVLGDLSAFFEEGTSFRFFDYVGL